MKERIKEHFEKHKIAYSCGLTGFGVAGITWFIMRDATALHISRTIGATAQPTIGGLRENATIQNIVSGRNNVLKSVSYISANRQGPPSWVVRCKETGAIFTSQRTAAFEMGLAQDHLSNHLNGIRDHVNGFHFERICLAA